MVSTISIVANCDKCHRSRQFTNVDRPQVLEELRAEGWEVDAKKPGEVWPCKCPTCKQ